MGKQRSIRASFTLEVNPKPGISPVQEPGLHPAKAKPPVLIYKVFADMCHFLLPVPSPLLAVTIQFMSKPEKHPR